MKTPPLNFDKKDSNQNTSRAAGKHRGGRGLLDISALIEEIPQPVVVPPTLKGFEADTSLPPELEGYLPAAVWRKLKQDEPPREALERALKRMQSIFHLVASFVPGSLVQEKKRRPIAGLVDGKILNGTLLFSDVSGFTALSERLAALGPEGAERLTTMMNRYFEKMLDILARSDGILIKFAGDAMLVFFPEQRGGRQALWAVRAGLRMLKAMQDFSAIPTPGENVTLAMKIGAATGEFLAASVGSAQRMEYGVMGSAVNQTMEAESLTRAPGDFVVNQATADLLGGHYSMQAHSPGYVLVSDSGVETLDDFEIKVEARRARSTVPWSASPQETLTQVRETLHQVQAISPFLPEELLQRVLAQTGQRRMQSEYRPAVVMFCNFDGLSPLLDAWNNEGTDHVTGLFNAYFNDMQEVIHSYGGVITRIDPYRKGTKMLVLFGAPVSHEDDAQRAVSAALAMNIGLTALNERWQRKLARRLPPGSEGPLVTHRIGITRGETFAGQVGTALRREYTVMGDDVNLAARLMGAAEMGQILINQRMFDTVSDYFVLSALRPIRVKGKSNPIHIYQVEGPRDETLARRVHSRGPLLGRDEELARAAALLKRTLAGECAFLSLQGPAGIGKSHFADALLKEAAQSGAQTLFYQCRSYAQDVPFGAWSGLLRALAQITSLDHLLIQQEKINRMVKQWSLPDSSGPALARLMGVKMDETPQAQETQAQVAATSSDPLLALAHSGVKRRRGSHLDLLQQIDGSENARSGHFWQQVSAQLPEETLKRMENALCHLLGALARTAPLVLFFEDAQWLDGESLCLLASLYASMQRQPLLVLLAQRGECSQALPGETLRLGALTQDGTTALVSHILVSELALLIHEQSNGSPLFVDEMTRWLQRTRKISASDLKSILQSSDILQQLVLSSLENLPEEQREIIRMASIMGTEFRVGEVQALMPQTLPPATLSAYLRNLSEERWISLSEAGVDARYSFRQALVRDILYHSLPVERRQELHTSAADYLRTPTAQGGLRRRVQDRLSSFFSDAFASDPAREAEKAAGHYEQAQSWRLAAGCLLDAARATFSQRELERCGAFCQRALQDLSQIPSSEELPVHVALRNQVLQVRGDVELLKGDFSAAAVSYEGILLPANTEPQERLKYGARLALVSAYRSGALGRATQGIESLQGLLDQFASQVSPRDYLNALVVLCWLLWREQNTQSLPAQLAACRAKLPAVEGSIQRQRLNVLLDDFTDDLPAVAAAYQENGAPVGAALVLLRLGDRALQSHDLPGATDYYRQAKSLWISGCGLALADCRQAELYWQNGATEQAIQTLQEALNNLSALPQELQVEGRALIQQALENIQQNSGAWPATRRWRLCDDAFRIPLIFNSLFKEGE